MEEYEKMERQLKENFKFIQLKIEDIQVGRSFDIKQISDLQRFTSMQKDIVDSLSVLDDMF